MTKVSIVIPTYNRKEYVQEAIDSTLAQTYADYEVIVIDDGSTDGTGKALKARYGDKIRYVWQENQGESAARNHGIRLARGEYIALLDSDDLWAPEKLAKQVPILEKEPDTVLIFSEVWPIDANGQRLSSSPVSSDTKKLSLESLCLENSMGAAASTALIRRETIEQVGGYDESIQYGEDWDLWLRLRQKGEFAFFSEPLGYMRRHSGSQWHNPQPKSIDERLASQIKILERVFTNWTGNVPDGFCERAMAQQYGMAGLADYLVGRAALGQQRVKQATELDPEYLLRLQNFSQWLVNSVLDTGLVSQKSVEATVDIILEAFEYWPPQLTPLSDKEKSQLLAKLYLDLGFLNYEADNPATVRYCLMRAIHHDPSWLRNRGVWSIGVRTLLNW